MCKELRKSRRAVDIQYVLKRRSDTDGDEELLSAQAQFIDGTRLFKTKDYKGSVEKFGRALDLYGKLGRRVEEAVTINCIARSYAAMRAFDEAIKRYQDSLSIYRTLADAMGEAITLHELATAYLSISRYEEAIANFKLALDAQRKAIYRQGEALALRSLGVAYSQSGQQEIAITQYEQALIIFKELNDRAEFGRTLNNIGLSYNFLSRYDKALENYQQALAVSRELKDRQAEGRALGNIGKANYDLSRYEEAIKYSEQALAIFREVKESGAQGVALNNIGLSYNLLGRYDKAIEYFVQALTASREAKDQANEGRVLNNIGNAYYSLRNYEKATDYYQQALELRRRIKDRRGEGITLGNLGKVYNSLGKLQQSIEVQQQALAIKKEIKDRAGEAHTLSDLGNVYRDLGQPDKALDCFEQSLTISREVNDRQVEADSLWELGVSYESLTKYDKANDYYEQSLALFRELKDPSGEGRTLSSLMLMSERDNDHAVAILYGKQAVNTFQAIRSNITSLDRGTQLGYVKSHEDVYRKLADILITQGRLAEAESVLELLKDEEFNRIIRRNGPSNPGLGLTTSETDAEKITDQLALLASERGTLLTKVANKTATDDDRQKLNLIETRITDANRKIKAVLIEITKTAVAQSSMIQQSQPMMQSLRRLGPGVVALYTVIAADKGWVVLTTSDFRRAYPINTNDLNKTVSDFRVTLQSDRYDPLPLAQKLYSALFLQKNDDGATLAGDLKAYHAKTLMWSLDGVLRYVPVGALHDGKGFLIEKFPNIVFTPASLTRLLDPSNTKWQAFGLGVSKEHKNFPALPAVPRELHSIIRDSSASTGVMPGVIKLDEQFTWQSMLEGLREGYPVVHIASHFRFVPEREETSYLLLGDGTNLSLEELQNSPGIFERVELLTLSACDTATVATNGKDAEGLAYVAQNLGAKAVVASLWPVADVGTEVLMREFYELREANPEWSKAEALRQAQVALLRGRDSSSKRASQEGRGIGLEKTNETTSGMSVYKRDSKAPFAHPHYWAPFILIGNWK
jgi:CHAT domain-containing protein/tetratricopeptide (TPR) repeat protein